MACTFDLLDNMEDVKQRPASKCTPGDLGALASAALRLAQANTDNVKPRRQTSESPPPRQRHSGRQASSSPSPRRRRSGRQVSNSPSPRQRRSGRHASNSPSPRHGHSDREFGASGEKRCRGSANGPRKANAALPHDLFFTVPPNCRPGQQVRLQGPHGPLSIPLPQGYQPGERCRYRFGPAALEQLSVPAGGKPGDVVKFEGRDGEELETKVPPGKEPGDVFEVTPPVVMVQVPEGAQGGDELMFIGPDGRERKVSVPRGIKATQYFPAKL